MAISSYSIGGYYRLNYHRLLMSTGDYFINGYYWLLLVIILMVIILVVIILMVIILVVIVLMVIILMVILLVVIDVYFLVAINDYFINGY